MIVLEFCFSHIYGFTTTSKDLYYNDKAFKLLQYCAGVLFVSLACKTFKIRFLIHVLIRSFYITGIFKCRFITVTTYRESYTETFVRRSNIEFISIERDISLSKLSLTFEYQISAIT